MSNLLKDLEHSFRTLRRSPGFTVAVVLTLGIGIGANTTLFSVVNGVLLRDLPFHEPGRLVMIYTHFRGSTMSASSEANFLDYRSQIHTLEAVGAYGYERWHLDGEGEPRRILVTRTTAKLLPLLGVQPFLGRTFTTEETEPGAEPVVVLGYGLWQSSLGGRPEAVGQTVRMQGKLVTVVGVMPPSFQFPRESVEAWAPLPIDPANPHSRENHYLGVVGRMKDGFGLADAQAELSAYGERVVEEFPANYKTFQFGVSGASLHEDVVGEVRGPLLLLLGAVGFVLLIGCANVANLLLARAESRSLDLAIRSAIGAPRSRILSQLMAESIVLSLAGGFVGLVLTYLSSKTLVLLAGEFLPRLDEVGIDFRVLGFTLGVSLFSGMLAGWLPAQKFSKLGVLNALQQAGRGTSPGRERHHARRALIVAEVALAVVLVIGAGILIRSFGELAKIDAGFRTDNVLTMRVSLPEVGYEDAGAVTRFYRTLEEHVGALPGVQSAGIAQRLPLASGLGLWSIQIDGKIAGTIGEAPITHLQQASPGYFAAVGLELVEGRLFSETDDAGKPPTGVVNEAFVHEHYSGDPAIGKRVRMWEPDSPWVEIVGVVGDILDEELQAAPYPKLYIPHSQAQDIFVENSSGVSRSMALVVHARLDAAALSGAVRNLIREVDRTVPVSNIRTMADIRSSAASDREFPTLLMSVFGLVALVLAAIGIYAMVSYSVSQRTREIGIHIALGADSSNVRWRVVGQALTPVAIGLVFGLWAAFYITGLLRGLLYNVTPTDPITFVSVAVILFAVAALASYLPARRASRVDPMTVLRAE